ncbi:MAG: hypothetical protein AB7S68_35235 [Polyangiaceae bacterium]
MREHVPSFRVVLDDVSHASDAQLRSRAAELSTLIVPLTLWALRDGRRGIRILRAWTAWADTIAQIVRSQTGLDALFAVLRYIAVVNEAITTTDLNQALASAPSETRDALMTLAEQWMAEGEARGRAEGEARGRAEGEARGRAEGERRVLERQLRRKFGDAAVDDSVLTHLATAEEAQLVEWAERVLDAESLDAVFR